MKKKNKNQLLSIHELRALFPTETAGNIMITDIPIVLATSKVKSVKDLISNNAQFYQTVSYVYVVNKQKVLQGVISVRELFQSPPAASIRSRMVKNVVVVNPLTPLSKVAWQALKYHVKMMPVVDHDNHLIGAVASDQLLEILNKQFSQDLLKISGIRVDHKHFSFKSIKIVLKRYPWILVGMLGGLLTGLIINHFKTSLEEAIILAVFIPVIMSTGATMSNQSAMVFLRNLLYADIRNWWTYVLNELKISSLLGVGASVIIFVIIVLFTSSLVLAFIVSFSLLLTILAASLIGVFTPMLLNRFHFDPALGAGPFLTIVKDLVAMTIYFTVATSLLKFLL